MYEGMISTAIDEEGVYPHQSLFREKCGKIDVVVIVGPPRDAINQFWNRLGSYEEVCFGLDMTTRPGQGTKYADALVFVHWQREADKKLMDPSCFKVGVINYQHEPRKVDPIDWDNEFWQEEFLKILATARPEFLVRVESS